MDPSLRFETLKQLIDELIGRQASGNLRSSLKSELRSDLKRDLNSDLRENSSSDLKGDLVPGRSNAGNRLQRLTCKLVGSYDDEKRSSLKFLNRLFDYLARVPNVEINLRLACLLMANTKHVKRGDEQVNCPIFYGAAVEVATNELVPAEFTDRGPAITLRAARRSCQAKDLVQVYNSTSRLFIINEFRYFFISNLDFLMNAPDEYLLTNFSTSPKVEPPHFVNSLRQVFALMKTDKQSEQTHRFRREPNGAWIELDT